MNLQTLKIPCHIEAEQSLLGAILMDYKFAFNEVSDIIETQHFYKDIHQEIYAAMFFLQQSNIPIDVISLSDRLEAINKLSFIGGITYLTTLASSLYINTENIAYYAKVIKGKAQLRNLIDVGSKIQSMSYDESNEYQDIVDEAEKLLFQFTHNTDKGTPVLIHSLVQSSLQYIEKLHKNKNSLLGVSSGYAQLDKLTYGFQKGDLIVLAARPSMGKTSLAINIACNIGIPKFNDKENPHNLSVLIFSLEMSSEQLMQRIITSEARLASSRIKSGETNKQDITRLYSAIDRINNAPIFISEASSMSYYDIKAAARRIKSKHSLSCIIIDYLQLISTPRMSDPSNRQNEVAEISRNLKMMAVELNLPVIVLSQLSRDVEKRQNKAPILSDLRDSGAIEQDADIVMFIHRESYYQKTDHNQAENLNNDTARLIISKHRNGPIGEINMFFYNEYTRFEEVDSYH